MKYLILDKEQNRCLSLHYTLMEAIKAKGAVPGAEIRHANGVGLGDEEKLFIEFIEALRNLENSEKVKNL
jgi:hypothetical protein